MTVTVLISLVMIITGSLLAIHYFTERGGPEGFLKGKYLTIVLTIFWYQSFINILNLTLVLLG